MSKLVSTIRPVAGADGPFFVQTEQDNVVKNVTLGLANISAALDQCKTDQAGLLGALSVARVVISTDAV